ncbi:hypothetical protein [Nitrosomonas sp. Is37]|uniref:hypothetical protein n=1 Tax=Nitrosomonas sp. Is37 TaxID=3080535 RepID=UPI00294B5B69|nr:hypothetical protein [Nitrosomonas sp. Is37]MDV6343685.1 hypothetical protein [Nitrosomonas sp. Is37]
MYLLLHGQGIGVFPLQYGLCDFASTWLCCTPWNGTIIPRRPTLPRTRKTAHSIPLNGEI